MYVLRRAVACLLLVSLAISSSASFPDVPAREEVRSSGLSLLSESLPPAEAFTELVAALVTARGTPFRPPLLRAAPKAGLRGIDVSHYQGRIDWARVASSGRYFVIAKATEGRTWIDGSYLRNKANAEAHHLAFGAYHFARPDRGPYDAVREANHFLDVARLEPGNVIPVLDLESTGGLSQRRLTRWILTWLRRVRERLGVRPMVYTSPLGWAQRTGNTTRIADAGYELLWVAHWGVREPMLPARGWGGHGWTLWQQSECGQVPGIRGCVDVNRLAGYSMAPLTITVPDTTPPSVRVLPAMSFTSPVVVSFDEVVGGVTPHNVFLTASGGGEGPRVRLACRSGIGTYVGCASGDVRKVVLAPRRPLVPGEAYEAVVNPASAPRVLTDRAGNVAPAAARTFTAPTELEQGSAPIAYAPARAWQLVERRDRPGGRVLASGAAGASAQFRFTGTGVVWRTVNGPNHGLAAIWVDGRYVRTVDTFSEDRTAGVSHRVSGLETGLHTLRIVVLGKARSQASGTSVAVDGFRVMQRRVVGG